MKWNEFENISLRELFSFVNRLENEIEMHEQKQFELEVEISQLKDDETLRKRALVRLNEWLSQYEIRERLYLPLPKIADLYNIIQMSEYQCPEQELMWDYTIHAEVNNGQDFKST